MMEDRNMQEETEYKEAAENETSEIEKLTDDCLMEIFQRLPTISDKIRIERVCKRWQKLSQRSWNNFQSLDFSATTWGVEKDRFIRWLDVDKIISLSGRYLTSISTDVATFATICHFLPKILRLQLIDECLDNNKQCKQNTISGIHLNQRNSYQTVTQCTYDAWQEILSWLMSRGENILSFKMRVSHSHYNEEIFSNLLREMKQLKCFNLDGCDFLDWSGTSLLELPFETIQEIVLASDFVQPFDINLLFTMIQKYKKLQTLGMNFDEDEFGIFALLLSHLASHAASLKNFKLRLGAKCSEQWQSVLLSAISVLTHLEKLDLSSHLYSFNDVFLEEVIKNSKNLTYLNLSGSYEVTDRGISSICNLEKLAYLNIDYMRKLRNPPLEKLTSLVVLDSYLCADLQEECLCTFLRKARQLRALNVRACDSVGIKLLRVADEVSQIRKSNHALDLYVHIIPFLFNPLYKKPIFCNIISTNYNEPLPLGKYGLDDPFNIERREVYVR